MMQGILQPECEYLLMAKSFWGLEEYSERLSVPMLAHEMKTPLHLHSSDVVDSTVTEPIHRYQKGAVAQQLTSVGVSVVDSVLTLQEVQYLRNVVTNHPEFKKLNSPLKGPAKFSRYLDPLCQSQSNACKIWDKKFLDLLDNEYVLREVESILGDDVLVDSTTLSIQWPGHMPFGPHVDRPFVDDGDAWPYSVKNMKLPSVDYPLSIQVLYLLDNFTAANGAFYYIPKGFDETSGGRQYPQYEQGIYPNNANPQLVTASLGSAIFAHGSCWHGAASNFLPRPRIAFLVQYVPRFIRPGRRFPYMILLGVKRNTTRLQKLLDVHSISNEYDKIYFEHEGVSFHVQYAKRDFKELYDKAYRAIKSRTGKSDQECRDLATIAENEAIQRTLLSYDVCHPPLFGQGKNVLTGKSVASEGADKSFSKSSFKPRLMLVPQKPIEEVVSYPQVAFGIGSATASLTDDEIISLIRGALKLGIRHFDMAEMYGNQKAAGKLFGAIWQSETNNPIVDDIKQIRRDEVFITSKIWCTNMAPQHVRPTIELTLNDLKLKYLDLWLIHWPVPLAHTGVDGPSKKRQAFPVDENGNIVYASGYSICDTWREMEKAVHDGLVRDLGVSNFPIAMLHELLNCYEKVRPLVNQVESHPYLPQHMLSQYASVNNISLQAYSPLGGFADANPSSTRMQRELFADPLIIELSEKYKKSPAQILLQWNKQRGWGIISTSRRLERVKELVEIHQNAFQLEGTDMSRVNNEIVVRKRYMRPAPFSFLWE